MKRPRPTPVLLPEDLVALLAYLGLSFAAALFILLHHIFRFPGYVLLGLEGLVFAALVCVMLRRALVERRAHECPSCGRDLADLGPQAPCPQYGFPP